MLFIVTFLFHKFYCFWDVSKTPIPRPISISLHNFFPSLLPHLVFFFLGRVHQWWQRQMVISGLAVWLPPCQAAVTIVMVMMVMMVITSLPACHVVTIVMVMINLINWEFDAWSGSRFDRLLEWQMSDGRGIWSEWEVWSDPGGMSLISWRSLGKWIQEFVMMRNMLQW